MPAVRENIVRKKSYDFAIRIVKLCDFLRSEKQEFILSKQLLRSGTAIGALVREAINAESKKDFIHKLCIAQKECDETLYWLELLKDTSYLSEKQFESIHSDGIVAMKIICSIIIKTKQALQQNISNS